MFIASDPSTLLNKLSCVHGVSKVSSFFTHQCSALVPAIVLMYRIMFTESDIHVDANCFAAKIHENTAGPV